MENRISKKIWSIFNSELLLFLNELEVNEELSESTPNEIIDKWIEYINREYEENKVVNKIPSKKASVEPSKLILTPSKNIKKSAPNQSEIVPKEQIKVVNPKVVPKSIPSKMAPDESEEGEKEKKDVTPTKKAGKKPKSINKFEDNTCQYVYARNTKNNIKGQKCGVKCTEAYCSQHKKTVEARLKKEGTSEKSSEGASVSEASPLPSPKKTIERQSRESQQSCSKASGPKEKKEVPKQSEIAPKSPHPAVPKTVATNGAPKKAGKSPLNLKLDLNTTLDKYVHKSTSIVFDKVGNINFAIGRVDKNNKIHPLGKDDLNTCNEYGFKYRTSDTVHNSKSVKPVPKDDSSEESESEVEETKSEEGKEETKSEEGKDIHTILKEIKNNDSEDDIIDEISTEDEDE